MPTQVAPTAGGHHIAYNTEAGPNPVMLIHGFTSNARLNWERTGWIRMLTRAGRGTLAVDLRGHGGSSKPHDPAAYSPGQLTDDVTAALDHANLGTVDIVTYSMGGVVALELAERSPRRVGRLVLGGLGQNELFGTVDDEELRTALLDRENRPRSRHAAVFGTAAALPDNDPQALYACATGMRGTPTFATKPPAPTLLVAGENDTTTTGIVTLARHMGLTYTIVPGRNHFNTISSRTARDTARDFLDSDDTPTRRCPLPAP